MEGVKWLVCGGVAGVSSKVIMLPLDMVKKRMEVCWVGREGGGEGRREGEKGGREGEKGGREWLLCGGVAGVSSKVILPLDMV